MFSAPPDRLHGWQGLLNSFGVAREPTMFGKLLQKARNTAIFKVSLQDLRRKVEYFVEVGGDLQELRSVP